jgi:hypothetical protein
LGDGDSADNNADNDGNKGYGDVAGNDDNVARMDDNNPDRRNTVAPVLVVVNSFIFSFR